MAMNNNPASRIYRILDSAIAQGGGKQCTPFWTEFFSVRGANSNEVGFETVRLLSLLSAQAYEVVRKLKETSLSEDLYSNAFQVISRVFAVETLPNQWDYCRQLLAKDVMVSLKYCAEILPSDEESIDAEELSTLDKEIDDLWQEVEQQELPEDVKAFVLRHLAMIKKAIKEYPIVGIRAFQEAQDRAMVDIVKNAEVVRTHSKNPKVRAVMKYWAKVKGFIDAFGKWVKFFKDVDYARQIGERLLDSLNN